MSTVSCRYAFYQLLIYPRVINHVFCTIKQRMTIIGVILSFRQLLYEALNDQLKERIPFLFSTIQDLHDHSAGAQVN